MRCEMKWRGGLWHAGAVAGLWVALACVGVMDVARAVGAEEPVSLEPKAAGAAVMPHIKVDVEKKTVDLEAKVNLREAKWLELLACTPGSRDHEAVLTTPARPSHIHLALLMIGLEPGAPMRSWREDDDVKSSPPRGSPVLISIITREGEVERETPANEWVVNQKTQQPMDASPWLFTGSEFFEVEGQRVYRADANGTTISLVNFLDDLLARDTPMTNNDDDATWGCHTAVIPPVGTAVTIRMRPAPRAATRPAATQPAE